MIKEYIQTINQALDERLNLPPINKFALLSIDEKLLLRYLSKNLSSNSIIVEVGCYVGASTAIMADANPQVQVHSFDPFDEKSHDPNHRQILDECLGQGRERTYENVRNRLNRSNIILHKGYSPQDFQMWDQPIDMYFEDGLHRDPIFSDNIKFWSSKLKVGGILAIHDYRPWLNKTERLYHIDVITKVEELKLDSNWDFLGQLNSLTVFKKLN
jgi:hypothetical protein